MSPQKLASLVEEGLDMACEQLFNEISIKVMLEPDDGPTRENYSPLTEEELAAFNACVDSPNKIHPSSVFGLPLSEISAISADVGDLQGCDEDDITIGKAGAGGSTSSVVPRALAYPLPGQVDDITVGQAGAGGSTSPAAPRALAYPLPGQEDDVTVGQAGAGDSTSPAAPIALVYPLPRQMDDVTVSQVGVGGSTSPIAPKRWTSL
jgi:hypothetical protein